MAISQVESYISIEKNKPPSFLKMNCGIKNHMTSIPSTLLPDMSFFKSLCHSFDFIVVDVVKLQHPTNLSKHSIKENALLKSLYREYKSHI